MGLQSLQIRILKGKISLVISALLGSVIIANAAPTAGIVTSGNATISQTGNTTNINQSSQKASINWQNFNIASNETVNFNQPNKNSITLNRVVGNEKSVIDGTLNANGQVWILNSNGILFNSTAKVNTSGLVATTAELSDKDFQDGNYNFKNSKSNSVVNLGTIEVANNSYVVLASNEVRNNGTIKAIKGKVYLSGNSEYTINLNGNSIVNLIVTKGILDSMVENSGTIVANGGEIYLTTNAVNELLKGIVNNTGVIEANSLDDVTGKVEVFAHGGTANVGGTINAEKGFVETSGKDIKIADGTKIKAKEWLIDPVNITIDSTLAGVISNALNSGDVIITTDGNNTPSTSSGESGINGDIIVNSAIIKTTGSKTKLTLAAERNIAINASISGSNGSPLDVVLASRYKAGVIGEIYIDSIIKSYGGDITIGGGDINASGFAYSYSLSTKYAQGISGIYLGKMIDATSNGSAIRDENMPTSSSGGNISIRGKGIEENSGNKFVWGVYFYSNRSPSIITAGNGNIHIEGQGGNSTRVWNEGGSVGIMMDAIPYIKAENGNITIVGISGTGYGKNGILNTKNSFILGTNANIDIRGDSLSFSTNQVFKILSGVTNIYAPIVTYINNFQFEKTGSGILNFYGDSKYWHEHKPTNTTDTNVNGTFVDATNNTNVIGPVTIEQALYAFNTRPSTITQILPYSLSSISNGYEYTSNPYFLSNLWNTSSIFGSNYSGWIYGIDYVFKDENNNVVSSFVNAGSYNNIKIDILKSGFNETNVGSINGSLVINPRGITLIATDLSKRYGDIDPTLTYRITNGSVVGNDNLGVNLVRAIGENVNRITGYEISNNGILNSNYDVTFVNGKLNISPKIIIVKADNLNKKIGREDPLLTYEVNGLVDLDVLDGELQREEGERIGLYKIKQGTLNNENYEIVFEEGQMEIQRDKELDRIQEVISKQKMGVENNNFVNKRDNIEKNIRFRVIEGGMRLLSGMELYDE